VYILGYAGLWLEIADRFDFGTAFCSIHGFLEFSVPIPLMFEVSYGATGPGFCSITLGHTN
jgi:hypothetical protein